MSTSKHSELILDQFTRQAVPFATAPLNSSPTAASEPAIPDSSVRTMIFVACPFAIVWSASRYWIVIVFWSMPCAELKIVCRALA